MSNIKHHDESKAIEAEQLGENPTSSPASQLAGGFSDDSRDASSKLSASGFSSVEEPHRGRAPGVAKNLQGLHGEKDDGGSKADPASRPRGGGAGHTTTATVDHEVTTIPPEHQPKYQPQHDAQLPTHEKPSGSTVGIGSLPGSSNEFGVALLPDERGAGNPHVHSQSSISTTAFAQGHNPFKSGQKSVDMPTTEIPSGSSVGIGSTLGSTNEPGVATLPEEREHGRPYGTGRTGFEDYSPAAGAFHHVQGADIHQDAVQSRSSGGDVHQRIHQHLIEGLDHHAMSKWELPSKEDPSGSRCGVGSLPGPNKEAGVALLPEERHHDFPETSCLRTSQQMPSSETPSGSRVGVGSLPGKPDEQGVAVLPEERLHPADEILVSHLPPRMDQMPSPECASRSQVGVNSIPGSWKEEGVALTPDERLRSADELLMAHPWPSTGELPSEEHPSGSRVGVDSVPGTPTERGVAPLSEGRLHPAGTFFKYLSQRLTHMTSVMASYLPRRLYLPSRFYLPLRMDEMPSTEPPSGSIVAVGSLPGTQDEQDAAPPPTHFAEDHVRSPPPPFVSRRGVGGLPGKPSEQFVALLPEEWLHPADEILDSHLPPRMDQMPSTEHPSGSKVGVGSLPGEWDEEGVGLTPEERVHPADEILMLRLPPRMDQMPAEEHKSREGRRKEGTSTAQGGDSRSSNHKGSPSAQPQQTREEAEHEARVKGEERIEMMCRTMGRVGGDVKATVEGARKGLEGIGHKVRRSFGWEQPGGHAVPATSSPQRTPPPSPGEMGSIMSRSRSGEGVGRIRSDLSPTAPEFVPHFKRASPGSSDLLGGERPEDQRNDATEPESLGYHDGADAHDEEWDARVAEWVWEKTAREQQKEEKEKEEKEKEEAEDAHEDSAGWLVGSAAGATGAFGDAVKDVKEKFPESVDAIEDYITTPLLMTLDVGHTAGEKGEGSAAKQHTPLTSTTTTPTAPADTNSMDTTPGPSSSQYRDSQSFNDVSFRQDKTAALRLKKIEDMMAKIEKEKRGVTPSPLSPAGFYWPIPAQSDDGSYSDAEVVKAPLPTPASSSANSPIVHSSASSFSAFHEKPKMTSVPANLHSEYYRTGSAAIVVTDSGEESDASTLSQKILTDENGTPVYLDEYEIDKEEVDWGRSVPGDATLRFRPGPSHVRHQHQHGLGNLTGAEGVDFNMGAEDGMLPGYPTQAGMSKLVSDRIAEDRVRAAAAEGKQGVQTTANTMRQVPHLEPRELTSAPEALPLAAACEPVGDTPKMARNLSTCAVRGSSSDLTLHASASTTPRGETDRFSGNMTPAAATMPATHLTRKLDPSALGEPLPIARAPAPLERDLHLGKRGVHRHHEQKRGLN